MDADGDDLDSDGDDVDVDAVIDVDADGAPLNNTRFDAWIAEIDSRRNSMIDGGAISLFAKHRNAVAVNFRGRPVQLSTSCTWFVYGEHHAAPFDIAPQPVGARGFLLQPVFHAAHFVLVVVDLDRHTYDIRNSLREHNKRSRMDAVNRFISAFNGCADPADQLVPAAHDMQHVDTIMLQQGTNSNDCALFVMRHMALMTGSTSDAELDMNRGNLIAFLRRIAASQFSAAAAVTM